MSLRTFQAPTLQPQTNPTLPAILLSYPRPYSSCCQSCVFPRKKGSPFQKMATYETGKPYMMWRYISTVYVWGIIHSIWVLKCTIRFFGGIVYCFSWGYDTSVSVSTIVQIIQIIQPLPSWLANSGIMTCATCFSRWCMNICQTKHLPRYLSSGIRITIPWGCRVAGLHKRVSYD